jgi:hypothetical protein
MADIVMKAKQRREHLVAELARLDAFLAMAAELAGDESQSPGSERATRAPRHAAKRGIGAETVAAALAIVRDRGPQLTRDLLPTIKALGIQIGGKSEIATLSARLSSGGKGVVEMSNGKWREAVPNKAPGSETASEREESAGPSLTGRSADSLFRHQTKEDRYAAALA